MWKPQFQKQERARLANGCRSAKRGHLLWVLRDGEILCYVMSGSGDHRLMSEGNLTLHSSHLTCPITFLEETKPVNKDWRREIYRRDNEIKARRADILKDFKAGKKITLILGRDGYELHGDYSKKVIDKVLVESARPLQGRAADGLLYNIPVRLIREIITEDKSS